MATTLLTIFIIFLIPLLTSDAEIIPIPSKIIGVNYGQQGNNLPSPSHSINLIINTLKAGSVKLHDSNPDLLKSLSNTNLQVSITIPNQAIYNISSSQALADEWVQTHVLPFNPETRIRFLLVGTETLRTRRIWFRIVPAMRRIKKSLRTFNILHIKVGTTVSMEVLEPQNGAPPSNGSFRPDIAGPVIRPMLQFYRKTKSYLFLDVYTYSTWCQESSSVDLDYALLRGSFKRVDHGSGLTYTNLLDEKLDAVYFAMEKLGFSDIPIVISETGWPSDGDIDQIGANVYNAATYNRNLVKRMTAEPPMGTPARPGVFIPTFLFALYNENMKGGPGTERNWGLLYPNGTKVYDIDLTGRTSESEYKPLPAPMNNKPYKGDIWCVVAKEANNNMTELGLEVKSVCGKDNETCNAIQPGRECYKPDSMAWHASYAFSMSWAKFRSSGMPCFFNGLAVQTTKDPSHGSCKFPSVTL